jgi:hypothetical protein
MFSRVLLVSFLALSGVSAFCQEPQVAPLVQVPYFALYDDFFFYVTWLEDVANRKTAQGKDGAGYRSLVRQRAGLTDGEEATLKALAADWRRKNDALTSAVRALRAAGALDTTTQAQQARAKQYEGNALDHVAQLQAAFGHVRFKLLDVFVRRSAATHAPRGAPPPK